MRTAISCAIPFLFAASTLLQASDKDAKCRSPRCGEMKSMPVITISLAASSTGQQSKRITYSPPPGWYVRSHRVEIKERSALASFTVSTVPREWSYLSEEQVRETYKGLLDLAAKAQNQALGIKLAAEEERTLVEVRKAKSSHHALVVEASVKGEGVFRANGTLQMTVIADLVWVGTGDDIIRTAKDYR